MGAIRWPAIILYTPPLHLNEHMLIQTDERELQRWLANLLIQTGNF